MTEELKPLDVETVRRCACGAETRSPGQRTCRSCHATDMRERRRLAKERGTYTLAGPRKAVTPRVRDRQDVEWPRMERVSRGKSRGLHWSEKPCARHCGSTRDLAYAAYCSECRRKYMRFRRRRYSEMTQEQRNRANCRSHTRLLIERGTLPPQPCQVCGDPAVQAHHVNYDDPRAVVWLCVAHHRAAHASAGAAAATREEAVTSEVRR